MQWCAGWLLFCAAMAAAAGEFPAKPLRLVIPFPPGAASDIVGRMLGEKLSQRLGQQFVIDNRGGAGGNIGMELTAKSPPDGYTIVIATVGTWAVNPHLYKLPFDVVKDFAPITQVSTSPGVLVVHPSVPAKSVKELIAIAKARPGELNYGSSGVGGFGHICGELFTLMSGTKMTHIPYKSSAPSLTDVMSGQIQVLFNNMIATVPYVKANRIRALATTGAQRSPALPELPTLRETGVRDYEVTQWYGVFVPAKTPTTVVSRLNAEIVRALGTPEIRQKLGAEGAEPVGSSPNDLATFLASEIRQYTELVQKLDLKPE